MILRRLFSLTALTVAATLTLSGHAHANYDVSTSIAPANVSGAVGGVTEFGAGSQFVINTPAPITVVPATSFVSFVDDGGSTIYLVNEYVSNVPPNIQVVVYEGIYINAPAGVGSSDNSSWSFNETITTTNPSGSMSPGSQGTYSQLASYTMIPAGSLPSSNPAFAMPSSTSVSTKMITVNSGLFVISSVQAENVLFNSVADPGVSNQLSEVLEPASVVMFGLGLAGVTALAWSRRSTGRLSGQCQIDGELCDFEIADACSPSGPKGAPARGTGERSSPWSLIAR